MEIYKQEILERKEYLKKYINSNSEFKRPLILNIISGDSYKLRLSKNWSLRLDNYYPLVLDIFYKDKFIKKYNLLCSGDSGFYITYEDLDLHFGIFEPNDDKYNAIADTPFEIEPLFQIYYYGENITEKLYKQVSELAEIELDKLS